MLTNLLELVMPPNFVVSVASENLYSQAFCNATELKVRQFTGSLGPDRMLTHESKAEYEK